MTDSWLQPVYFDYEGNIVRPQWIVVWQKRTGKRAIRDPRHPAYSSDEGFLVMSRGMHFVGRSVPDDVLIPPGDKLYILHWSEDIILKLARQVLRDARRGGFMDEIGPVTVFKGSDDGGEPVTDGVDVNLSSRKDGEDAV